MEAALNVILLRIVAAVLLLGLAGCVTPSSGLRDVGSGGSLPAPDTTNAYGAYEGTSEYRLGANDEIEISVQVAGKLRGRVRVAKDADEAAVRAAALTDENVKKHLGAKEPRRVIYVAGRLINFVP